MQFDPSFHQVAWKYYRPVLKLSHALHRPMFFGWENIPQHSKLLFVGNHTLYGVLDAPLMHQAIAEQTGLFLRSLGDRLHFKIPVWRDLMRIFGVVEGSREHCSRLMQDEEPILVFPGGGREVAKRKGELYQLIWKRRMGFARMAIEHGYTIIPFSAVGVEDMFKIILDANEIKATQLGPWIQKFNIREDILWPLSVGNGAFHLPSAERFYFRFGAPIETDAYVGQHDDEEACWMLREDTRKAVEEGLQEMRQYQQEDAQRKPSNLIQKWSNTGLAKRFRKRTQSS